MSDPGSLDVIDILPLDPTCLTVVEARQTTDYAVSVTLDAITATSAMRWPLLAVHVCGYWLDWHAMARSACTS